MCERGCCESTEGHFCIVVNIVVCKWNITKDYFKSAEHYSWSLICFTVPKEKTRGNWIVSRREDESKKFSVSSQSRRENDDLEEGYS